MRRRRRQRKSNEVELAKVTLSGWPAVILVIALLALTGHAAMTRDLHDEALIQALDSELELEYLREVLPAIENSVRRGARGVTETLSKEIIKGRVEVVNVFGKGHIVPFWPRTKQVVGVVYDELRPGGKVRHERYYRVRLQGFVRWDVGPETTETSYWLDLI